MTRTEHVKGDGYNLSGELLILFDRNERLFQIPKYLDKAHQIFDLLLQQNLDNPDLYETQLARAFYFAQILGNQLDVNFLDKLRQALSHLSNLNKVDYRQPRHQLLMLYGDRFLNKHSSETPTAQEQISDLTWVIYLRDPLDPKPQHSFSFCLIHLDDIENIPPFDPETLKDIKGTYEVIHHQIGDHEVVVVLTKHLGVNLYLGPFLIK